HLRIFQPTTKLVEDEPLTSRTVASIRGSECAAWLLVGAVRFGSFPAHIIARLHSCPSEICGDQLFTSLLLRMARGARLFLQNRLFCKIVAHERYAFIDSPEDKTKIRLGNWR